MDKFGRYGLLTAAQAWAILRLIEIHNYTWIDSGKDDIGLKYRPWSVDHSKLMPLVVTALQNLVQRIAALEAAAA